MESEQKYLVETASRLLDGGDSTRVTLIVRHSIRNAIETPDLNLAYTARLTREGKELAWDFGRMIDTHRPSKIFHSPVPRCVDTAHLIRRGIIEKGGQCELAGSREYLEAPFVRNPMGVMEAFVELGTGGFARKWADGTLGDIIDDIGNAGRNLLDQLSDERKDNRPGSMTIFITHDLTIVALLSLVFDVGNPGFAWPCYLGGTILAECSDGLCLHYQGNEKAVY